MLPGRKEVTEVPALKSSPKVGESKVSIFSSINNPVVLELAIVKFDSGIFVDKFAVVVGGMAQIAPTAQVPMTLPVSFSIVRDGFANVSITDV